MRTGGRFPDRRKNAAIANIEFQVSTRILDRRVRDQLYPRSANEERANLKLRNMIYRDVRFCPPRWQVWDLIGRNV